MDNFIVMEHYFRNESENQPKNTKITKKNTPCDAAIKKYKDCLALNKYILGDKNGFTYCENIKKKMELLCG